jgi:hypothetical protein
MEVAVRASCIAAVAAAFAASPVFAQNTERPGALSYSQARHVLSATEKEHAVVALKDAVMR